MYAEIMESYLRPKQRTANWFLKYIYSIFKMPHLKQILSLDVKQVSSSCKCYRLQLVIQQLFSTFLKTFVVILKNCVVGIAENHKPTIYFQLSSFLFLLSSRKEKETVFLFLYWFAQFHDYFIPAGKKDTEWSWVRFYCSLVQTEPACVLNRNSEGRQGFLV